MSAGAAIYARLAADATLVALLGEYLTLPCIFYPPLVPPDAPRPYVVIEEPVADVPLADDIEGGEFRAVTVDIGCYTLSNTGAGPVDAIAGRVRELLHHNGRVAGLSLPLAIPGYTGMHTRVLSGPTAAQTDATLYGRTMTVLLTLAET